VTCQGSVPEAIICFLQADCFEEAVRLAVSLDGDSDTQAAIAGSIAAARYGVPEKIKAEVIKRLPDDLLAVYYRFDEETNPVKIAQHVREYEEERRGRISPQLFAFIIECLGKWKSETSADVWEVLRNAEAIDCHHGLGMWIRNTYLWKNEKLQAEFFDAGYYHVDDMSNVMIEIWIEELNKTE